eukprot:CAMPEP_0183312286 /NCGR_PEP_ID=MMETSP0160_2-20130417/41119_1 /TAXON_ID=2839 ORGANISM="Odontella Sinensis, Strain Grunow 1884" /NCGR_SAMPLE_ID=MMETSP0160_2 /ASSEMBLY_ACC=CAM_ASM_000250 /LENGTH=86 /DNA_ID=CAMNT_0025477115 /DNA_START=262 /DNA_END=518 /DNA_ORIENTATION=+
MIVNSVSSSMEHMIKRSNDRSLTRCCASKTSVELRIRICDLRSASAASTTIWGTWALPAPLAPSFSDSPSFPSSSAADPLPTLSLP